jgi:16S rRNA pseudouridine516 synthase
MEVIDARHARLTLIEGRYHQVKRMFAATGNRVLSLHRSKTGKLDLYGLESGQWRIVPRDEAETKLFS